MVPTTDLKSFINKNDSELRSMVRYICDSLNYVEDYEDVVQDIYMKFLTKPIIQSYQKIHRKFPVKMSTYIYSVVKNLIYTKLKNNENKIAKNKYVEIEFLKEDSEDTGPVDNIHPKFRSIMTNNDVAENPNGLPFELKDFQKVLDEMKEKKFFKKGTTSTTGCCMRDLFNYLYSGYSNREIAEIYGVTNMSVTHMKQKLAEKMAKYGFVGA